MADTPSPASPRMSLASDLASLSGDDALRLLRDRIDSVDARLLALICERAVLAQQVGEVKARTQAPVYRPEREAQVLRALMGSNPGPLPADSVATIFREVMSACRALERKLVVAYLGPEGTFSEQAVLRQFGQAVTELPCATIDEVFRAVETAMADFGVVPVENSTEGAVSRTLDLFFETPLKISAEVSLPIHHNLLTLSGDMSGIRRICAHAQALAQCNTWLNQHCPGIERVPVSSNAEAARMASLDSAVAAVAGEVAQVRYGLKAVASHIQDDSRNRTRFAVIGTHESAPSGEDQTSLILSVPDRAGAVHDMIVPFKHHGVSMKRFESRPARNGTWEYNFYIDVIGHQTEAHVAAALADLRSQVHFYKVLGSYPRVI